MERLLEVKDLQVCFNSLEGVAPILRGVSFGIGKREVMGLVGESGCGKSVTALSILRLLAPTAQVLSGEIILHRRDSCIDLLKLGPSSKEIREIRGKEISMIFQEPMTSFSPVYSIGNQIVEAILLHQSDLSKKQAWEHAVAMLDRVGIPQPRRRINEYPHHLSGGMRQRAMIAMALVSGPRLVIADEPTTALDVTTQAQILDLMIDLQSELGMAVMMITHNLGVIAQTVEKLAVMYLGKIVESGSVNSVFVNPLHPYTQLLLQSVPVLGRRGQKKRLASIEGVVPDAYNIPGGCSFHPRCPKAKKGLCDQSTPKLSALEKDHEVACLLYD